MSRISATFTRLQAQGRKALIPFITADRTEQDAVRSLTGINRLLRQRRSKLIICRTAGIMLLKMHADMELLINSFQYPDSR